ncbi:Oligopeptide transporter 4 [Sesamum alatum]|uniref:Oligopeptide transporter 4 n=1 Tax=Sesamum alatum TaxID=300844 RepID=A0AAE1YFG9_9LAMI|nr:Oligopeptide transporter 4 [Sesamum alatum]
MASFEIDTERGSSRNPTANRTLKEEPVDDDEEEVSPVEQVRLTVPNEDDPTLPVWTFRMWFLGLFSCMLLSFLNTFFSYRSEPLVITMISVQVATLPIGRFMAKVLPTTKFRLPGFGSREFSLNPGPFNMKEHVLISIFANAGSAFGGGSAYAVGIVDIIKAFYKRNISFLASWILVITTQVLGYGWAGILRKYVVEPAEMWWPSSLVQVSLFRALHEKDSGKNSRSRFFLIALACSFSWYIVPGYLFSTLSNLSLLCLIFPKSVTAQQLGSGMKGLGIASLTFDWSVVASYLGSPLVTPFFAILNVFVGYFAVVYVLIPIAYWGLDVYHAKTFPIFSSHLFNRNGQIYNVSAIVNDKFEIDLPAYERQGRINLSIFFALSYGLNFAAVVATLTHVIMFNGKEIYERYRASHKGKPDIHTRLMKKYKDIPSWWFHAMLLLSLAVSLMLCIFMKDQVQLPWWGLIFSAGLALIFTLPISIITATTNQTPGLNVITEYLIGIIYPGRPIANVCFKTYGYISMSQAVSFLNDFKLGHYMKVPPRSMFIVQLVGTMVAGTINIGVACRTETNLRKPGELQRTQLVLFGGAVAPVFVWLLHKAFPSKKWIKLINLPVLLGATAAMPPATTLNFNSWILVGTIFNLFVFRYRKRWWQRYNYVLSAALDAGLAFMGVVLYLCLGVENVSISWWGSNGEHCDLASCPTAKGVAFDGCPVH